MAVQEDDREHMYKDKLYHLLGSDGWVDIRDLTVHIEKRKDGVKVSIYTAEHDGVKGALASCEAEYIVKDNHRKRIRRSKWIEPKL